MPVLRDHGLAGCAGVVTGAAGGIGLATAQALVAVGARVQLVDRLEAVHDAAAQLGPTASGQVLDLSESGAGQQMLAAQSEVHGPASFLVNAAGVQTTRGPFTDLTDEDWETLSTSNLRAVMQTCRAAAGVMAGPAAIVNVASISGTVGMPGIVAYGSIKAAIAQLTRGLAVELAPTEVRVNAVAPGYIDTAMTSAMLGDPQRSQQVCGRIPMGRIGTADEVADVVLFLISRWARYITGEVVHVDGGYRAQ